MRNNLYRYKQFSRGDSRQTGFTLVELLVVIAIIGVLVVVTILQLNNARQKARDVKRVSDIRALHSAVNLFHSVNEYYPSCTNPGYSGGCDVSGVPFEGAVFDSSLDGVFVEFLSAQLSAQPRDPLNNADYYYMYGAGGEYPPLSGVFYDFGVAARLENSSHPALQSSLITLGDYFMLGERR